MNKNIYDGCGIISSELLKKNFEGFKQDEVVINFLKGTRIPFDMFKYDNIKVNQEAELKVIGGQELVDFYNNNNINFDILKDMMLKGLTIEDIKTIILT
jgi:hypothetical protein